MSDKTKKTVAVLVILVIFLASFVLMVSFPISEQEAVNTANAFLEAVQSGNYAAAALLYHPGENMTAEELKMSAEGDPSMPSYIRHHIPFDSALHNIEHRGLYPNRKANTTGRAEYFLTSNFSCDGTDYVITFYFYKNIFGYGITDCSCFPKN